MRVGFIGTGTIAGHMVRGMGGRDFEERWPVVLSPRGEAMARELQALPGVSVAASNQAVLEACDVVVLAVRPQVAEEVLRGLRFARDVPVISLIAAMPVGVLQARTGVEAVCRAIPLPFVERGGVTPVYPALPVAMELFGALGGALAVSDEALFDVYATASAVMGTYFGLVGTLCGWMEAEGVAAADARAYVGALFGDLGQSLRGSLAAPEALRLAHTTPGGLNAQCHEVFVRAGGSAALAAGLASVLGRVRGEAS